MLTNSDIEELTAFRRALHRRPELSGEEAETARAIATALEALGPDQIVTGLGGHGVAAVFDRGASGPTVMFRAELDGLAIQEIGDLPWKSEVDGKGHLCGHDGHMTMLLALGRMLSRHPVARGRVVLMFQPAEEDGSGARAVVADPRFAEIAPDWAFAIHNLPGRALGTVATRTGLINCASLGLKIRLTGKTAHAATPQDGISPAGAVSELIPRLEALCHPVELEDGFRLLTITHLSMGAPSFGIAPGEAEIFATLRTGFDEDMQALLAEVRRAVSTIATGHRLEVAFSVFDEFAASVNNPDAAEIARSAMDALGIHHDETGIPMRASEDFGVFGQDAKAAMLCLGSGREVPALHNPDYDFPDDLIPIGAAIFNRIARDILGED